MATFPRRAVLLGGLTTLIARPASAAGLALPQGGRIAFAAYRKGRKIGEHLLEFTGGPDDLMMRAQMQITVALGPVPVFRYRHKQTERWKGGRFESLETDTLVNGEKMQVSAQRTGGGVRLEGGRPSGGRTLPPSALPLTHWNRASLGGPLFNPQDGKMMRLSITAQGAAPVVLGNGRQVPATRIALTGETSIEDWYDEADVWTGLRAKATDGSVVEYRRI